MKFRIGLDSSSICGGQFARLCEDAGADMISVHGRTRDKVYAGEVDFSEIAAAKRAVNIPVIANGGVFCKKDAEKLYENTGADGIMVARGAMYKPWIFAEITGREIPDKKDIVWGQLQKRAKSTAKGSPACLCANDRLLPQRHPERGGNPRKAV